MGMQAARLQHEEEIERVNSAAFFSARKQVKKEFEAGALDGDFAGYVDPSDLGQIARIYATSKTTAESAAWSARSAWSAAYRQMAAKLIELISAEQDRRTTSESVSSNP